MKIKNKVILTGKHILIIMKIYIEGFLPKFDKIQQFYKKTEITKMIYSTEGIFSVETNNIFKMIPVDKPIKKIDGFKCKYKKMGLFWSNGI